MHIMPWDFYLHINAVGFRTVLTTVARARSMAIIIFLVYPAMNLIKFSLASIYIVTSHKILLNVN